MNLICFPLKKCSKSNKEWRGGNKYDGIEKLDVNCRTDLGKQRVATRSAAPQLVKAPLTPVTLKDCNMHPVTAAHGEPALTWPPLWFPDIVVPRSVNPTACFPRLAVQTDAVLQAHCSPKSTACLHRWAHGTKHHYTAIHQVWQPTTSGNCISKKFMFSSNSQLKILNIRLRKNLMCYCN